MSPGRPKAQRTGVTTAANEDIVTMVRRSQVPPVPKVHPGTQTSKEKPEELSEESSNSSEDSQTDEEMDEEAMSSSTWIMKKAKHCQKCKKEYPTAGEASTCLVAHKLLRCYFCFRVCKNVEMLHQHYSRAHRRGGPDGFVDCPCCKGSIPFKSVSCHVISKHLTEEESSSSEDSQTDEEMDEEAMSSPTWYINKAKHCQKCKQEYPTAGEASTCVTAHNRLRCYFCFRVCKNVQKLFEHYSRAHTRGDQNGFVDCPCCKQSIPFKAVSCHVISMHLTEAKRKTGVALGPRKAKVQPNELKNVMKTSWRPKVQKVCGTQTRIKTEESSPSEDSETDEDIKEKDMSRPAWINKKAKHCQKCKKDYPTAGEASTCLTAHKRLRCFFCFRVCKNTEKLFQHFSRAHRGDRNGFVNCPCCKQSIPFKAVSCHVISMHLAEAKRKTGVALGPRKAKVKPNELKNVMKTSWRPKVQKVSGTQTRIKTEETSWSEDSETDEDEDIKEKKPELLEESSNSSEDSGTDSEMDEKAMSSPTWYINKAKHCQKCKKDYPTAGEASTCLTAHKRLRCFFCFRVCKNTEKLFQHFSRAHRGDRNGFVNCPCCKQSIPFKAVSCHVISMHLTQQNFSRPKNYRVAAKIPPN